MKLIGSLVLLLGASNQITPPPAPAAIPPSASLPLATQLEVRLNGVTPTQAVLRYDRTQAAPCSVRLTDGAGQLVPDFDPTIFPGAGSDDRPGTAGNGVTRLLVAGRRRAEKGRDGRWHSRALAADTEHEFTVECGPQRASLRFRTVNPPLGNTYPELPGWDPGAFGNWPWPSIDWRDRNRIYVDPLTGMQVKRVTGPGDRSSIQTGGSFAFALEAGQPALSAGGNTWRWEGGRDLFLGLGKVTIDYTDAANFSTYSWSLDDLRPVLHLGAAGEPSGQRKMSVCLSADSGQSCYTREVEVEAARGGAKPVTWPLPFPSVGFSGWGQLVPRHRITPSFGRVNVRDRRVELQTPGILHWFNLEWPAGTKIGIPAASGVCPGGFCTVERVISATQLVIREDVPALVDTEYMSAAFGILIRKKSGAGPVTVAGGYELAATMMFEMLANGSNDLCSRRTDTTPVDAQGHRLPRPLKGHLCVFPTTTGFSALYFVVPETGEVRYLSEFRRSYDPDPLDGGGSAVNVRPSSFDTTDPRAFYALTDTGTAGTSYRVVFQGRYEGDFRERAPYDTKTDDRIRWKNLTPRSQNRDLVSQFSALRKDYDTAVFPYIQTAGVIGRKFVVHASSGQEASCLIGLVDLATGLMAVKDTWSEFPGRFGTCHTIQNLGTDHSMLASINAARYEQRGQALAGPWRTAVTHVWRNGAWSPDTSINDTEGEACPPDQAPSWTGLAPARQCLRIRIRGEACSATPTLPEKERFPCPHDRLQSMLQPLAEGDLLTDFSETVFKERFRILKKTARSAQDIELVVQRRAQCAHDLPKRFFQHAAGWTAYVAQPGGCHGAGWWLDVNQPTAPWRIEDARYFTSHNDIGPGLEAGRYSAVTGGYATRFNQPVPDQIGRQLDIVMNAWPTFGGSKAVVRGNGFIETYPSLRQWTAPVEEKKWVLDFRAYQAGAGVTWETPLKLFDNEVIPVAGEPQVYRISNPLSGLDRKILPTLAWAGRFWMRDISGPASRISGQNPYTYCVADREGECRPGARKNEVFVSLPGLTEGLNRTMCATNHYAGNYPCFLSASPVGGWVVQREIGTPDPAGLYFRRLSMGWSGPGRQYTFSNARALPDGSWAILPGYWLEGYRSDLLMVKLPRWPGIDGQRRDQYAMQPRKLDKVPGAEWARVEFGYAENGSASAFYCTSRGEPCVATGTGPEPFAWLSEAPRGVPCANGCLVQLPGISGRVRYSRVEWLNARGEVVRSSPLEAETIP